MKINNREAKRGSDQEGLFWVCPNCYNQFLREGDKTCDDCGLDLQWREK